MRLNDAVFGILLLLLGGGVLLAVQGYPKIPGQPVGPALFPALIAIGLCLTGAMLLVRGWRARREQTWVAWDDWVRSKRHVLGFCVVLFGTLFYIFAAGKLGFLPCAFVVLLAMLLVLRVPPPRAVVVAVIVALAIHFAFYKLLRVPLPWGVLTPYSW